MNWELQKKAYEKIKIGSLYQATEGHVVMVINKIVLEKDNGQQKTCCIELLYKKNKILMSVEGFVRTYVKL